MSEALRLAREAQAIFEAAEEKNRGLTVEERRPRRKPARAGHRPQELESKLAESAAARPPDGSRRRSPPGRSASSGPGDVFVSPRATRRSRTPTPAAAVEPGMVECHSGGPALNMKGTLLETAAGGPAADWSRRTTSRHRQQAVRAARRGRPVRQLADDRWPGPIRRRGHRDLRRRRCGRGGTKPESDARTTARSRSRSRRSRPSCRCPTRCSRTRRRSRPT